MKRLRDLCTDDDDVLPLRPAKRFSMMDNTPQQWKEERRHILKLSKQKLKKLDNPLRDLQKSVLINNTRRRMKLELEEHSGNKHRGYKRNHASARHHRKTAFLKVSSWESDVMTTPVKSMRAALEHSPLANHTCGVKCEHSCTSKDSEFSDIEETVLNHMMDLSSSNDSCSDCANSSADAQSSTVYDDKSQTTTNCPGQITPEHCESNRIMDSEHSIEKWRIDADYTDSSSHKARLADSQSVYNECNYTALESYSHSAPNLNTSNQYTLDFTPMDTSNQGIHFANTISDVYTPHSLLYKQYCAYNRYLHSVQNPFELYNQFLFRLTELMHNNSFSGSSLFECNSPQSLNSFHSFTRQCETLNGQTHEQCDSEDMYVDVVM